jgi:hypothetical protein
LRFCGSGDADETVFIPHLLFGQAALELVVLDEGELEFCLSCRDHG